MRRLPARQVLIGTLLMVMCMGSAAAPAAAQGHTVYASASRPSSGASTWDLVNDEGELRQASRPGAHGDLRLLPTPIRTIANPVALPVRRASSTSVSAVPFRVDYAPLARGFQDEPSETAPRPFQAKDGFYIAGLLHRAKIDDEDFDGMTSVSGGGSTEILPTADAGSGTGWAIGVRNGSTSMEFNYTSADHEGMHVSRAGVVDSTSETYNFDFRRHFNLKQRFQPHVLFGIGIGCLTVDGGSIGLGRQEEASFTGLGVNLGVGAAYYATNSLSLALDLGYRIQSYASVDGVVDGSLASNASGSGSFTGFRVSYTF